MCVCARKYFLSFLYNKKIEIFICNYHGQWNIGIMYSGERILDYVIIVKL